ncbi:hypothetical protein Tco_1486280, partial [Tanacetum coccineum]
MVVIDDHDMIDIGEGSTLRNVIDTCEGSIPRDVFDVGVQFQRCARHVSDIESYRNDPNFAPTLDGTRHWRPDLPEDEKPKLSDIFDTFDDGYNMYKVLYSDRRAFRNL